MPFETQPIGEPIRRQEHVRFGEDWRWLSRQPSHRNLNEWQISSRRPGVLGPTASQVDFLQDPNKYRIAAPMPAITERAATQKAFGRFGTATLDLIDPFMTIQSVTEGLGATDEQSGEAARGAQTFLGERDIDPFGQGGQGVPARLFDYATGWLGALYDEARGAPIVAPTPQDAGALKYAFQRDPGYWALVGADEASDEFLAGVAKQIAGRYVSGDSSDLVAKLLAQFKLDREIATGLSSGDRRLDYQAKLAFTVDYVNARTQGPVAPSGSFKKGVSSQPYQYLFGREPMSQEANTVAIMSLPSAIVGALPFVGADIREAIYKTPQQIEAAWGQLTPQQREQYFGRAGLQMLAGDVVVWLPLLSGAGAVEATAARSGGLARTGWKAYEFTRNVTVAGMATGLSVATANWALEAAVPGYAEGFGKRLDYARPISSSALAGVINQMGFFASGTFGAYTAARALPRVGGKVAEILHVPRPGLPELAHYRFVYGGSAIARELAGTELPNVGVLDLAPKAEFLSQIKNWLRSQREAGLSAYVAGKPTFIEGLDAIDDQAIRLEVANARLLHGLDEADAEAEGIVRAMAEARRPRPLFSGEAQRVHDAAVKLAKYVDDEMARVQMEEYGPAWLTWLTGSYTRQAMETYARSAVARLGGKADNLGRHNEEGWAQVIRSLHAYEFHVNDGLLRSVGEGSSEAEKLVLMQADHLFANDVAGILNRLRGEDAEIAAATAESVIRSKREAAAWFAKEYQPAKGADRTPASVPPTELADWIEEVQSALPHRRSLPDPEGATADMPLNLFHRDLEEQGLWTLGFKPVDEAGNTISYVRQRNGQVFKSPWIDYPHGNTEAVELGNRGLLLSKVDGITRGFRTWRIIEFQKGLLYRRLASRLPVTAEQIERFHAGVMRLAREKGTQPQTVGAVARSTAPIPGAAEWKGQIEHLVNDVFGPGPHLVAGKPVDWADEIAKSYRQSFRLNLTAGLTSFLKANLGEAGSLTAWMSDIAYVMWRFGLSPIFKGGEVVETYAFNAMRGVRGMDPLTLSLYNRAGVGRSYDTLLQEQSYDDMVRSLTETGPIVRDASGLAAASEAFYARQIPEDFALKAQTAFEQGAAAEMRAWSLGGQLPSAGWFARNTGKVVDDASVPADFSTKLGDHRPDLLDPEQIADEQELYHATVALTKVYEEGLKARNEIAGSGIAPRLDENFLAWRNRIQGGDATTNPALLYLHMSAADYAAAAKAGEILRGGLTDAPLPLVRNADQLTGARDGFILELDKAVVEDATSVGYEQVKLVDWGARNRVWRWDETAADFEPVYRSPYAEVAVAGQALGGGGGNFVSVTYRHDHALEIARRLVFGSKAARNEVTNAEILEHFLDWYGDDVYTMAKVLGASPKSVMDNLAGGAKPLKLSTGKVIKEQPMPGAIADVDSLVAWMDKHILDGKQKYDAVVNLDGALVRSGSTADGEFTGGVILAGSADDMMRLDPDDIGVVRVAARKGVRPADGSDTFELEFASDNLLVVDDRQMLGPLAEDEEGLLRQLRSTLAEQPKEGQLTFGDHLVGGNGIAPGLESRARAILTKLEDIRDGNLDGGPTFQWADLSIDGRINFSNRLALDGWYAREKGDLHVRQRLDGTLETRPTAELWDEYQRRPGAAGSMEDVAGTPEALFEKVIPEEAEKPWTGWRKRAWETFKHPSGFKLDEGVTKLQIKLMREEFPRLLALSGNDGLAQVFRELGIREDRWLDWLIEDRTKLAKWLDSNSTADWDDLVAHAGDDLRGQFDEMYASDDWAALSGLIRANMRSAGQEAFGVHFFAPYRSALERSINHPLLGLYPASWSLKAAREWARFLYNNRTLGIDIGMAPAQAIAQVVHAQHAAFAESEGEELDDWLSNRGPLGSPIFIFNLLMPGDWSALPFAASRTIRDYTRPVLAGDDLPDAGMILANNVSTIGLARDARLFFESLGQIGDVLNPARPEDAEPARAVSRWSIRGTDYTTYDAPYR